VVKVKNQSGDPVQVPPLIVVVQRIQNMAGLKDVLQNLELPGADGMTEEEKPYFNVPIGEKSFLAPFGVSEPFRIEIKNPNLYRLYPPVLRVKGIRVTTAQRHQEALKDSFEDFDQR